MKDVEVIINKFKAVNKADILLNGITVLSGVNSSGKSTISKLLYYTFKYANEFETIVKETIEEKLDAIDSFAFRLSYESKGFGDEYGELKKLFHIYNSNDITLEHKKETLLKLLNKSKDLFNTEPKVKDNQNTFSKDRYIQIVKNLLHTTEDKSLHDYFDDIINLVQKIFAEADKLLENRDYLIFKNFLEEKLGCSIDSSIHVNEYGYSFVGDNVKAIPIMEYIQQVIYIDTPMIIGAVSALATDYWEDLDLLLQKKSIPTFKKAFSEMMENIIHGETSYDEDTMHMYRYHRMDGKVFDLFDSATGIKSFSILQMLLNNGSINKNTLLIIDEPEAHLHPQWIVEYARLIVLMHKHIGTKFFIASHSTDFVSAIKYIATKENCLESLSYYLSEEDKDNPYTYNYRSLNTDIEPIFESFNKSFSLIEEYGADNA